MTESGSKIFYGWWITAASFVILLLSVGLGLYCPPVFLVPLQEHFGWSRAAIATGSSVAALISGLSSPLVGVWIDRFGTRKVMVCGAVAMGSAFIMLSFIESLWQLYVLNGLAALGLTCTAWVPNQTLISTWFDKKRGMAMGAALTGIGFGGLFMAPLAGVFISAWGWRAAFATLGAVMLVLVSGVILAVIRSSPADMGLLPDGEAGARTEGTTDTELAATPGVSSSAGEAAASSAKPSAAVAASSAKSADTVSASAAGTDVAVAGVDLKQVFVMRAFWVICAAHLLWVFGNLSIIGHLVAFLSDTGVAAQTAASTLGAAIGISVFGRVSFGFLADRYGKRNILMAALALHIAAILCLLKVPTPGFLAAFVALYGLGLGGGAVMIPLLVGECFGLKSFAKILGVIMIAGTLGAAIGPVLTGRIYDLSGSYNDAFLLHLGAYALAAFALLFLPVPRSARA